MSLLTRRRTNRNYWLKSQMRRAAKRLHIIEERKQLLAEREARIRRFEQRAALRLPLFDDLDIVGDAP